VADLVVAFFATHATPDEIIWVVMASFYRQ
jgi:hypothetical protein